MVVLQVVFCKEKTFGSAFFTLAIKEWMDGAGMDVLRLRPLSTRRPWFSKEFVTALPMVDHNGHTIYKQSDNSMKDGKRVLEEIY
jgi:hypothetical protein